MPAPTDLAAFIRAGTRLQPLALVPEVRLHLADDATALWHMTEAGLDRHGLAPPYWAFAWAGGQALARHLLDHPELVRGRRVVDFGAGSGLLAIAALKAGAAAAVAAETDPFARAAIALNAAANGIAPALAGDPTGAVPEADLVLCGDMFYERGLAAAAFAWLVRCRAAGLGVLIGDPTRAYLPVAALERIAAYEVPGLGAVEDAEVKRSAVWTLRQGDGCPPPPPSA